MPMPMLMPPMRMQCTTNCTKQCTQQCRQQHTQQYTAPRLVVEDDLDLRIRRRSWLHRFELVAPGLGKFDRQIRDCPRGGPRPCCRLRRSSRIGLGLRGVLIEDLELRLLVGM